MNLVGRDKEKKILDNIIKSNRSQFVVVYGRRRIGKTFLIKNYFNEKFSFYASGILNVNVKPQLENFSHFLVSSGFDSKIKLKSWFDAFDALKMLLESDKVYREPINNKRVIFLDETPWFDSRKSDFKSALDLFWNTYASTKDDIVLIVCGSATSWIVKNILKDSGGFYNRITNQIHLMPFSLSECEKLSKEYGFSFTRKQIIDLYMILGGVPYYWNLLVANESPMQNIQRLCFEENGVLRNEYYALFKSLFSIKGAHRNVIEFIAKKNSGVHRADILDSKVCEGKTLTQTLEELVQCGFVKQYKDYNHSKHDICYQLIDPFVKFSLEFIVNDKVESWQNYFNTPAYYAWAGYAFEIVCLNNIQAIKSSLGISGVISSETSFKSKTTKPCVQIDLLINRKDGITNVCEIKYSDSEYVITSDYAKKLSEKISMFKLESKTTNALHLTMIVSSRLKENSNSTEVVSVVNGDDLFL